MGESFPKAVHIFKQVMKSTKVVHDWDLGFLRKGKSDPIVLPPCDFGSDWTISVLLPASQIPGSREQPGTAHRGRTVSQALHSLLRGWDPSCTHPSCLQPLGSFCTSCCLPFPQATQPCPTALTITLGTGGQGTFWALPAHNHKNFSSKTVAMSN